MAAATPQDGDLIVRRETVHHGQPVFLVSALQARWETTCLTYDEAVDVAERTARAYKSNIWFTSDGVEFDLVASYRKEAETT